MTEHVQGMFRILAGAAKEYCGRALNNGALEASGKVEKLAADASLACLRARNRLGQMHPAS